MSLLLNKNEIFPVKVNSVAFRKSKGYVEF